VDPVPDPLLLRKSGSSGNRKLALTWPTKRRSLGGIVRSRTQATQFIFVQTFQ
jgi:hypothetical protein